MNEVGSIEAVMASAPELNQIDQKSQQKSSWQQAKEKVSAIFNRLKRNKAKNTESSSVQPVEVVSQNPEVKTEAKADQEQGLDFSGFTKSLRPVREANNLKEVGYEEAQKVALADRLDASSEEYKQIFKQLTADMQDDQRKKFIEQFNKGNPVLLKTLTLHLVDQKQSAGDKDQAQKLADLKNINGALDQILLKQGRGKVDHRAQAVFETKDINLALRAEPIFEESKPAETSESEQEHAPFTVIKGGKEDGEDRTA